MDKDLTMQTLLDKFISNSITKEELQKLFHLIGQQQDPEALSVFLKRNWESSINQPNPGIDWENKYSEIMKQAKNAESGSAIQSGRLKIIWRYWGAAAMLILSVGGYLVIGKSNRPTLSQTRHRPEKIRNDIQPGGDRATLTLADGSVIGLDSSGKGTLAIQGKTQIRKLREGQLAYDLDKMSDNKPSEIEYNQISTPRGGQYEVLLPDGTRVWLNAASSLRFPTSFSGESRNVSLRGEAYFEVAKNPGKPFKVSVDRGEGEATVVEVLGTHFNIMGYDDESSVNTTLIEGSVKVRHGKATTLLLPFQQAQTNRNGISRVIPDSDVEKAMAWKNGFFDFEDDDISVIMRQLSRWYDVDVHFEGPASKDHYIGAIRRQSNISKVLDMLQATGGVRFTVEGKNVTVKAG